MNREMLKEIIYCRFSSGWWGFGVGVFFFEISVLVIELEWCSWNWNIVVRIEIL